MKTNIFHLVKQADNNIQQSFLKSKGQKLTGLDVCLKWAPLAALLVLDTIDDKRKENLEKHLIDYIAAELLLSATLLPLKSIIRRVRPNGDLKSFPSRHVASSFLGSEMLRQELNPTHPALSYAGYAVAVGTAVLRLYHNKHWFSDVLAGALIGVLSVKLSPKLVDKVIYSTNIQAAV